MDLSKLTDEQRAELEEKLKNMSPEELAKLQSQECIFCSIIAGKIPSKKIYEDKVCIAFLDINPAAKGHILLLPKEHVSIMPQVDEVLGGHLLQVARELSRSLLKNLHASGSSIFIANGLAAGQRAQHFMIHIIPRREGDQLLSYEKHIVDEEKRRALRDLIAARMTQLTDFKDVYATEDDGEDESDESVPKTDSKVKTPEDQDLAEDESGDDQDTEDTDGSEDDSEEEHEDESEDESDDESEERRPGETTDSSLDDIANLFK